MENPEKSARLAELFPPERILLAADCPSKKRAFERVSVLLENVHGLTRDGVFSELMARERLGSTAVGNMGAIPHVRIKNLQKPVCALMRLAKPVQYDAQDDGNSAVQTLFFLIVPEKAKSKHLSLLALFSAMLMDSELMQTLAQSDTAQRARDAILRWEQTRADMIEAIFADQEE